MLTSRNMADVYVSCTNPLDVDTLVRLLFVDGDGDAYLECDNNELSVEDLLRMVIVEDDDGNPALAVYGVGGTTAQHQEFTTTAGQTAFTTTFTLNDNYKVFVDGAFQSWGHTRAGNTVTFAAAFALGHEVSIHQ